MNFLQVLLFPMPILIPPSYNGRCTAAVTRGSWRTDLQVTLALTVLWRPLRFLQLCPLRPRGDEARSHSDARPSRPAVPQRVFVSRPSFRYDEMACPYCTSMFLCCSQYVMELISLWLFLFAAQPKQFFLDGLKKLEQQSHKCVELRGGGGGEQCIAQETDDKS
jgi:hypothetical protein